MDKKDEHYGKKQKPIKSVSCIKTMFFLSTATQNKLINKQPIIVDNLWIYSIEPVFNSGSMHFVINSIKYQARR